MGGDQYGSVITEQGDLGLGIFPIQEEAKVDTNKEKHDKEQKDK